MFALSVHLADVQLLKLQMKVLENGCRLTHRWINLAGVTNVKAERGFRQDTKNLREIFSRLPDRFSLVRVLDTEKVSKATPLRRCMHCVWMNNDWPSARSDFLQKPYRRPLKRTIHRAWRMESFVHKLFQVESGKLFDKQRQLTLTQCRQLNRIHWLIDQHKQGATKVAPRESSGRKSYGSHQNTP